MLAAAGDVEPPQAPPLGGGGGIGEELGREALGDPEMRLLPLSGGLAGLVVAPEIDCALGREFHHLELAQQLVDLHSLP